MDGKDIAPELLERIRADFLALLGDAQPEADTYTAAAAYAELVGSALAEAFRRNLTADILPDGKLYWNIADRVVRPLLEEDYSKISDAAVAAQQALNRQARIGIAPQRAVLEADRVNGLLNKLAEAERFEDVAWSLAEPVRTFSRMAVDDALKANVDFQGRAGLRPRVVRIAESGCCKWCSSLAGTYDYPHVPKDVYRRHERCRCRVEYDPGEGRRQNVWNKTWTEDTETQQERIERIEKLSTNGEDSAKIDTRKAVGIKSTSRQFASKELLQKHYAKHSAEFGNISIPEYLNRANAFADASLSDDIVQLMRSDGSVSKYGFSTNEFIVLNADGTIRTYFKPKAKGAYWNEELERNK